MGENEGPPDSAWREWIQRCDINKCSTEVQASLRQFAANVGIGIQTKRRDLGFDLMGSSDNQPERFWALFEIQIRAGHLLQNNKPVPDLITWDALDHKTLTYKKSLGQAKRGLSAYAAQIMMRAFLRVASGESQRRIRKDGKLRTQNRTPVSFASLDAPSTASGCATFLDALSDSDREIPGVEGVCACADGDEESLTDEVLPQARDWAAKEFKTISGRKNKTVLIAIAATAMGISKTDPRVRAAANLPNMSSVASALTKYCQNLQRLSVFHDMDIALKKQFQRVATYQLALMAIDWANANHIFTPGISASPPQS